MNFDIFYDKINQNFFIEASPNLFDEIQKLNELQKSSIAKIIKLFRAFKWTQNDRLYFFRKKFLK